MGAFLLSAGAKGKRFALPNSEIMIHQPLGGAQGQASDILIQAEQIQKIKKKMTAILAENCGQPLKKVETVRVKGGTIDSVKAAAGYVKDKNGNLVAFVFIANNLASKDEALLRIHEDIIKQLLLLEK
jgi:D-alanyl-D-alanine carboxypeptidase